MNKVELLGGKEVLYTEHLDNGLDIYMIPNDKVQNFYITLNVKYGSIYTSYKCNNKVTNNPKGIAHYLEHLMFNMDGEDPFEYFSTLGSSVNAFTSNNITCYEVFANSKFKENLSYLLKFVYTPYFTKELVNKERGIITEEIKMYEDDPSTALFHKLYQNILINDEHRYLISGTKEDIKNIKHDDIKNIYDTFYHPKNMFLIITGNFNPEESVAITNEFMKNINFNSYLNPKINSKEEPFKINNEYTEYEMNVVKDKVITGFKIPKKNFKSLKLSPIMLKLYFKIIMGINYGSTSLLNEEMKSNGIINKSIGLRLTELDDYYLMNFFTETDYPDYFINRIKEVFNNISITKEDLNRKIKSSISSYIWLFDDIESLNLTMQDSIIDYDMFITDIVSIYKSLNIDTAKKVINCLNKYLVSSNVIKPKTDKSA